LGAATLVASGISSASLWWSDADVASRILLAWSPWFAMGPPIRTASEVLMIVGILAVFGRKLVVVRDPEERRRLWWLLTRLHRRRHSIRDV
jgi:hypothetical protein